MSASPERWLPVVGWEGYYEISDRGVIHSLARTVTRGSGVATTKGREIQRFISSGNARVKSTLSKDGRSTQVALGRVVLEAFVGRCPDGMECCHGDGDPWNNNLANLRWDTRSGNQLDSVRHRTHFQSAKTHCHNGHEFTESNTLIRSNGRRRNCRECNHRTAAARTRRYRQRQAAKRAAA